MSVVKSNLQEVADGHHLETPTWVTSFQGLPRTVNVRRCRVLASPALVDCFGKRALCRSTLAKPGSFLSFSGLSSVRSRREGMLDSFSHPMTVLNVSAHHGGGRGRCVGERAAPIPREAVARPIRAPGCARSGWECR